MLGRITDDAGELVTVKGYVHIYPQGSTAGSPDSIPAVLDLKGGFKSAPLDPGSAYDLLVNGFEGHSHARLEGVRPGASLVRVTLERAGLIKGKVVREDGGQIPVGMGVRATAGDAPRGAKGSYGYTYTQPNGRFTLNGLGDYAFRIAAGGAGSGFISADLADGIRPGATGVVIKVKRGVSLSGKLLDANGDPVKTHLVTAVPVGVLGALSAWTAIKGDDGVFHFAGVPEGKVRILAYIGSKQVTVGEVTAPAKDLVLKLPEE